MYAVQHSVWFLVLGLALASLLCSSSLKAQILVGGDTQLNLNGTISGGYAGSTANDGVDSHGITFGGVGNLNGSYYSPQFLSFDVSPFYNQSRNNSTSQSITDSSGVNATANIFGGSQFPGYVNYSKIYNSENNNYMVPGLAGYSTNGNMQTFGVGWSAHFQNLPSLVFGYDEGNSDFSLYGTNQETHSTFQSISGAASYNLDGFHLNGGVHYATTQSAFPQTLDGTIPERVDTDTTTYTFSMTRAVFWAGNTWFNFARNDTTYNAPDFSNSQSSDVLTGGLTLRPTTKLATAVNADYDDNLSGTIFQQVTSTGAVVPVSFPGEPSHSWGLTGSAQYSLLPSLYVGGLVSYRQQLFEGISYDSTAYGGSVGFGHDLLGGKLSASATATHNSYDNDRSMVGLLSNAIYIRNIGEWGLSTSFTYSQDTQTILIAYTSSGYSFSGSVNRRVVGRIYWNGGASGSESMYNQASSLTSHTQSYSTGVSSPWLSVNGGYSKSSGNGLITSTGVTPLPPGVPPVLVPTVLYSGTTYSASVGSNPIRGLTVTGAYIHSRSNTAGESISSSNVTEQAFIYLTYRVRKVYLNAGYSRLLQGFSASGLPPTSLSTYYVGLSRWFKAF